MAVRGGVSPGSGSGRHGPGVVPRRAAAWYTELCYVCGVCYVRGIGGVAAEHCPVRVRCCAAAGWLPSRTDLGRRRRIAAAADGSAAGAGPALTRSLRQRWTGEGVEEQCASLLLGMGMGCVFHSVCRRGMWQRGADRMCYLAGCVLTARCDAMMSVWRVTCCHG